MIQKLGEFTLIFLMLLALVLISMSFGGCASKPKDFKLCVEMSLDRGECMTVLSGQKIRIDKDHKNPDTGQDWWEMRPTNLILPLESWLDIKKMIIKMCKTAKNQSLCDKEVSTWERSLQKIDEDLKEKGIVVPDSAPDPEPAQPTRPEDDIYRG